ncbi:MAG: DUF262 domain-containing protein [Methylococcaceae bacterium]|nr:DUF262 domain-containing protein [Methylococcaceae bacterium]
MSLKEQVETKRNEIHTDAYPMSIGEIINLYTEGDLDIHPEFQRIYRWNNIQKSKLIESILLGIPLPSFFMAQREDGIWDVVDGLQRLSTIFSFLGLFKNENNKLEPPLILKGTEYLPSLEGMSWNEGENCFSKDLQRMFKREKIDLKIVKKESDEHAKYELFQRLNTSGSSLSTQEVRNCLLVMVNKDFYEWLKELSEFQSFKNTLIITSKQYDEQYHLELMLRFLILINYLDAEMPKISSISEFITTKVKEFALDDTYDRNTAQQKFEKTFSLLDKALNEDSFRKYKEARYTGGFSLLFFEVIAIGLGRVIDKYDSENQAHIDKIKNISMNLCENETYIEYSSPKYKVPSRLPHLLSLGKELFEL